jgi:hypothetical protein
MLFWLTDDDKRVPLKVETNIALGRVTAELIAAEVEPLATGTVTTALNGQGMALEVVR